MLLTESEGTAIRQRMGLNRGIAERNLTLAPQLS
jgi:hypothetical protein